MRTQTYKSYKHWIFEIMWITKSDGRGMRVMCRVAEEWKWNSEVELDTGVPRVEALSQTCICCHGGGFFCSVTDAKTTTKQEEKKKKHQKTTKTEKKFPNTKTKQKREPWKRKHENLPASYVFDKICEPLKDSIRSSQKHLFPQFRGASGPMRLHRPHVAKCPRKTPRNRSQRRNSGGTTHGSAARTPRVARCPTKTSRNRSESGIVSPQTHGAAGRTTAQWGPQTASRGPKWHSPRLRGAQKRAPHRRKTHPEPKRVRDMPPEKELSIFRFDSKTFR